MSEILEVPNQWKAGVITNKGLGLLSKMITGKTLTITRAETGTGWIDPELLPQQTAVSEPMQEMTFATVSYPAEGKCMIPCKLTNEKVETSYIARQIGVYAMDPDEGEILFYITQVEDEDGGTGIPAANVIPSYSSTWNLVIYYGMADGVDVTVDPAGVVSHEDMERYVDSALEEFDVDVASIPEIDEVLGMVSGEGDTGTGSGTYTLDHSKLYNRDLEDQHPIEAIEGLEERLDELEEAAADDGGEVMTDTDIDNLWDDVMGEGV